MTQIFFMLWMLTSNSHAGGSISRDEAISEVCAESQPICAALKSFELAELGSAARVGRHLPNGGERVMPYEFAAGIVQAPATSIFLTIDRGEDGEIFLNIQSL